jgi:hypothetical protein
VNPLPEPRNWDDKNLTVALGLLLFGASGVVGAVWTVGALTRGDFLTAAITAGGTVSTVGACAGVAVTRFKRVPLRGSANQEGTVLSPRPAGHRADVNHVRRSGAQWRALCDLRAPVRRRHAATAIIQGASGYAPNGAALYWMIRHYSKHPENRAELTDGRALERLRNEQFDPE